jgi:hypothetical protein
MGTIVTVLLCASGKESTDLVLLSFVVHFVSLNSQLHFFINR